MRRFYCRKDDIANGYINITEAREIHHIKNVLRMELKDKLVFSANDGFEYNGHISRIEPECIAVKIDSENILGGDNALGCSIVLACAIPKKAKIDYIIEKVTELGVDEFIPLKTKRTIVNLKGREESRLRRWRNIAVASSKQSGRIKIPKIHGVLTFGEAVDYAEDFDLKIIPNLARKKIHIYDLLSQKRYGRIAIFIGPEGDFTQDEIALAFEHGFIGVSLGENTLKVDTAAISTVSFCAFWKTK
ncbi:MAG: hypothetical protein COV72_06625 [Candidatus Omnitrophica bacterium CG11_big_fil_rev_8_21_14_0_20_42_13]|uniref:Ribosomal RNA small subunit methyltransferase E n=1 Tax=Candidatus Ghiorseimicrobium undicola TaxID=1974746 RepID=A0A2H0LWH0_9BACT|nr:MAG: hypothetical protein COV72_06625 [Candidatus Omnitrophica bacterium CG11_big_fil_rev_8_21_14_0_20_42_13]